MTQNTGGREEVLKVETTIRRDVNGGGALKDVRKITLPKNPRSKEGVVALRRVGP